MEGAPIASASTSSPSASGRKQFRSVEDIHISLQQNASGRRQWMDGIKDEVSPSSSTQQYGDFLTYGTLMQLFSWHFDVFSLEKRTGGNPLITVTMSLLELYGLLVR